MVSKGRRHDEAIRRRPPRRRAKLRILVVCEGIETEPGYLRAFQHDMRNSRVHVETIGAGGVPLTVVTRAIELRGDAMKRAQGERDDNLLFDEVWAVFDVDDHPGIEEAKERASTNGIECAISNPCFELWALLHFQDQRAHVERGKVASMLRKYMHGYEKHLDYEIMRDKYADAIKRAVTLDRDAQQLSEPGRNPTTGVYRLTENIRKS